MPSVKNTVTKFIKMAEVMLPSIKKDFGSLTTRKHYIEPKLSKSIRRMEAGKDNRQINTENLGFCGRLKEIMYEKSKKV